ETGEQVGTFPWDEFSSNVSLSADGARVLVPGSSGAEVHDLNTANLLAAFPVDESAKFDSKLGPGPQDAVPPQVGPDLWDTQNPGGILLVYIGTGRHAGLALWDIEKDRIAHKLLDREWAMLLRMASFVNRGRQVVAMSGTHVKVWDVKTGSLQRTLR